MSFHERRPEERPYTDGEALEIANDVSSKIIDDYKGMVIGGEKCGLSTDQLFIRIRRGLMAFHHREAHFEGTVSGTRPAEQRPEERWPTGTVVTLVLCAGMVIGSLLSGIPIGRECNRLRTENAELTRQLDFHTCRVQLEPMPVPVQVGEGPTLVETEGE